MSDEIKHPKRVIEQAAPLELANACATQRTLIKEDSNPEVTTQRSEAVSPRRVHERAVSVEDAVDSAPDESTAEPSSLPRLRPRLWKSVFWLVIAIIATWLAGSSILTFINLWQQSKVLAISLATLAGILLALLIYALINEIRALRSIDELAINQDEIVEAQKLDDLHRLKLALKTTLANLELQHPKLMMSFNDASLTRVDCKDYIETFNNLVLIKLDEEANIKIKRRALVTGAAVAITPHPALDAIIVLWRALDLIREIGELYGLRPTGLSSWKLMKYSFNSALLAAGADTAGSLVLEEAGRGALESAGKKAVEGIVIGSRIYRLGVLTQRMCRPIPK